MTDLYYISLKGDNRNTYDLMIVYQSKVIMWIFQVLEQAREQQEMPLTFAPSEYTFFALFAFATNVYTLVANKKFAINLHI